MPQFSPTTPDGVIRLVTSRIDAVAGRCVIAVDGADAADPESVAAAVAHSLRASGRAADVVSMHDWVRPASLRLEYGHHDELSYRTAWFDYDGLDREVLRSLRRDGRWLPAIWNEATDRSARAAVREADAAHVVIVAGPMVLGRGLSFDLTVSLRTSRARLLRITPADRAWTVPALIAHAASVTEPADVVVTWDHPDRPAVASD